MTVGHDHPPGTSIPATAAARVVGLALLLWAFAGEVRPGLHGIRLGAWALVVSVIPVWVGWTTGRGGRRWQVLTFGWMGAAGGAATFFGPIALAFVGTAAFGAALSFELETAALVAASGPVAVSIAVIAGGGRASLILAAVAAALAGIVIGFSRRQNLERAEQAAAMRLEHERAEVARTRAEVLLERNRLAREVHDVLAHTLGALAVQLEALDAQVERAPGVPPSLTEGLRRTRSLAADGLVEARSAVRALRDDVEPLETRLAKLTAGRGARLAVTGTPRALPSDVAVALYRMAQESLTNAAKHAPGAAVAVRLEFGPDAVTLAVVNGAPTSPVGELAASGAGYGLDGIRERVRLLGGQVTAGPDGEGWLVRATVAA